MPDNYMLPPSTLAPGSIAWAYLRDSGGPNQDQSVPQQEQEIRAYCKRHGLALVMIFADVGKSGGSVEKRDQFLAMIDLSADASLCPDVILVWNLARFSRDVDDSDYYKSMLRKRGIIIHSLTDAIPEGLYAGVIEKLVDTANQEYRRQNSLAVKRAIRDLVKQGYMTGTPPRGYIAIHEIIGTRRDGTPRHVSRWEPDPKLWDLVKLAWQMRADGRSYNEIMRATDGKVYKSANCWITFFNNRSYLGIGKWGDLEIENHHEAAVDQATWDAVQAIRNDNPRTGLRHPMRIAYPSLLSGLAYCSQCGAAIVYHKAAHRSWPFYICGKHDRAKGLKTCDARRIGAKKIDALVLDVVLNRVLTPAYFADLLAEIKKQFTDTQAIDAQITDKRSELKYIDRALQNLLDLAEAFGPETVIDRLKQKEFERVQLTAKIKQLEAQHMQLTIEITPEALALVLNNWRDQITNANDANDTATVRSLLSYFVERIEMSYDKVIIKYTYPMQSLMQKQPLDMCLRGGTLLHGGQVLTISLEV